MLKSSNGSWWKECLSAGAVGATLAVSFTALFAAVIRWFSLPSSVITPVNQFIKTLSVFVGCFFCLKRNKGAVKGFVSGALCWAIVNLLFAVAFGGETSLVSLLTDALFFIVLGALSGILSVNVKREE